MDRGELGESGIMDEESWEIGIMEEDSRPICYKAEPLGFDIAQYATRDGTSDRRQGGRSLPTVRTKEAMYPGQGPLKYTIDSPA